MAEAIPAALRGGYALAGVQRIALATELIHQVPPRQAL